MGKKLILTEKPSQASDFAKALKGCKKKNGYYDCREYLITWAVGHLFQIDDAIAPKRWSLQTLPIFPEKFKLRLRRGMGKQFKVIKELLKKADEVILASVSYDEPILIWEDGKPIFTSVGEFVDGCFKKYAPLKKRSDGAESVREELLLPPGRYKVPAFDRKGRVYLKTIRGVVRHSAKLHKLYRIKTRYGREIVASEHHSFFRLNGGRVETVETTRLQVGDTVLVPRRINLPERKITVDLLKELAYSKHSKRVQVEGDCLEKFLSRRAVEKVKNFFGKVAVFDKEALNLISERRRWLGYSQRKLATLVGVNQSVISLFERGKINLKVENAQKLLNLLGLELPFEVKTDGRVGWIRRFVFKGEKSRKAATRGKKLLAHLDGETIEYLLKECKNLKLSLRGTNDDKTKLNRFLEIDEHFAFFLGVFLADGSVDKQRGYVRLHLGTQKPHFSEVKSRILNLLERLNISYKAFKNPSKKLEEVRIYSQLLGLVLTEILGITSRGINERRGTQKDIPDILFAAPEEVKRAFVEGYLKSDGTPMNNNSTHLPVGLTHNNSTQPSVGVNANDRFAVATVSEKIYKKLPYLSHSCNLPVVFTREKHIPHGKIYLGHTVGYKRAGKTLGDLVEVEIISVEEVKDYPHPWIYDLSVETGTEGNFVCGKGGVCQHNTDPGREGELIAREILLMAGWKNWDKTYRFWTSEALTPEVIRKTLKNLKPAKEFDSLYYSALARQHGDWLVGVNLTRAVTLKSKPQRGKAAVWSVGRVQTPTLKMVVEREREIQNFKPEEYFVITATFEKDGFKFEGKLLKKVPKNLELPEEEED